MAKEEEKETKSNIHVVKVKIEGDSWKKAVDKAFKKAQKTVNVDGFRKGKVPRNIFEKKFGKEKLYEDAVNYVIDEAYVKAITDNNLEPVVRPAANVVDITDNSIEIEFRIITTPEVNVKKYKGLKVEKEKVEVTDEEIDHELDHLLEKYTELVVKDGKVAKGDIAIIDFEGFKDGVAFDGGKGENYSLEIGSNSFIPGFEEKIIGMKVGQTKDLDLTFPEDYGAKDLAGQPVVFKVKVNEIKEKKRPEMDEDFFEDLGMDGVDSEKKLRKEIKENIEHRKSHEVEDAYVEKILEEVSKNVEVDIPEEMVEEEVDRMMDRFEDQFKSQGLSLEMYYQFSGTNEKDMRSQMEKTAFREILYRLMLEKIVELEKVEVSDEDVEKEKQKLCEANGISEEELLNELGGIDLFKYDLKIRKAMDLLKELNK